MEDDEDDMYAPDEEVGMSTEAFNNDAILKDEATEEIKHQPDGENDEEEDDEDGDEVDDDSDIEIVTERKEGAKPEGQGQSQRMAAIRGGPSIPARTDSPISIAKAPQPLAGKLEAPSKSTPPPPSKSGSSYPAIRTSTIDLDAKPILEPSGKQIMDVDMDADFGEDERAWRLPGSDQTDFFNYGFDEFTWASYCLKQQELRQEAKDQKKQVEDMQSFLGMPALGVGAASAPAAMGSGAGPQDFPPEMQQMMNQMMSQGMDPSQLDFNTFVQMMGTSNVPGAGAPGFGTQGQNQQQIGSFGYGGNHGGGGNRSQGGRGRGRW